MSEDGHPDSEPRGPGESAPPPKPKPKPEYPRSSLIAWARRRREKVISEIERNRRGEYRVPTWALVVALAVVVGAWAAVIIFV